MELSHREMDKRCQDRRFGFAVFFSLTSTVALFVDKLSGDQYGLIVGAILTLFGGVEAFNNRGVKTNV